MVYIYQWKLLDYYSVISNMSHDPGGLNYFHNLTNLGVMEKNNVLISQNSAMCYISKLV